MLGLSRQTSILVVSALMNGGLFGSGACSSDESKPQISAGAAGDDAGGASSGAGGDVGASELGEGGEARTESGAGGTDGAIEQGGSAGSEDEVEGGEEGGEGGSGMAGAASTSGGHAGGESSAGGSAGSGGVEQAPENPKITGDIVFSVPSQSFRGELEVGMTTSIPGAEIRYTTDGSLPTASSAVYTEPLSVTATTELRALPFVSGLPAGQVGTALYVARTFEASSDLPILVVDGYGAGLPLNRDVYYRAAFLLFEPRDGAASLGSAPAVAARAGYHLRGQTSAGFPQLPYKIELWDNADRDADYAILGMPAESDWALIAPYYDRSLLRNPFMYDLARDIGIPAPRYRFVEVYVNQENRALSEADYQGIYWFTETIKNQRDRLNLKQLRETDTDPAALSGGYIFKFDDEVAEEPKLFCTGSEPLDPEDRTVQPGSHCWLDLEVVDPDALNEVQKTWLTEYVQSFHDALHQSPIGDYAAYIDVPSFVDYFLLTELSQNADGYIRSAYYHKDRNGKLKAGPLWDYNLSLGIGFGAAPPGPMEIEGFRVDGRNMNNWFRILMTDPVFITLVKARWQALRAAQFSDAALEQRIQALAEQIEGAVGRDYARWPVAPMYALTWVDGPKFETWPEQIEALRTFVLGRVAWLDAQLQ